ncbi:MAG: hypothetical protein RMJ51_02330 [Candidatus Calescibacterium sp.]|nr:hypothetical protein [Candidatus Calescibacterium sp.]MCX7972333.1 hypothetical protein [bacterium]MDW8195063.1 hypothetical protein [Candidatus Calescibacterium sp.]
MDLLLKIGNQNIFFIFAEGNKILKTFIIPAYLTLNKKDDIVSFGPYSFLQYIILKQSRRIPNYPEQIQNRYPRYDYTVKRMVENNIIQSYRDFYKIMEFIFAGNLEKIYDPSLYDDYIKYNIPYFFEIRDFYYLLKNVDRVLWINFMEENSVYFKNQESFLSETMKYWRYKFKAINFWEFFNKFWTKMINIYIAEVNSIVWIHNKSGFLKYRRIGFGLRKIKELLTYEFLKKDLPIKYSELERISMQILENQHSNNISSYIYWSLKDSISLFLTELNPTIIEDLYDNLQNDPDSVNSFNSVILKNPNISKVIISIFHQILIVG